MTSSRSVYDVIVICGDIEGSSIAYSLVKERRRVLLLEQALSDRGKMIMRMWERSVPSQRMVQRVESILTNSNFLTEFCRTVLPPYVWPLFTSSIKHS